MEYRILVFSALALPLAVQEANEFLSEVGDTVRVQQTQVTVTTNLAHVVLTVIMEVK